LRTIGDHIRKHRLDLRLRQKDAAAQIGADVFTLINWEKGRTVPVVRFCPAIERFLGYWPGKAPENLREGLKAARQRLGMTRREFRGPDRRGRWIVGDLGGWVARADPECGRAPDGRPRRT